MSALPRAARRRAACPPSAARPVSRPSARGFALVMVLWVLAGLTVVAVAVASSARLGSQSLRLLRDRVTAEAAFLSAGARLQMIAATGTPGSTWYNGPRGRIFVDGRPTAVDGDTWMTLQDVRGLVNLNDGATRTLSRLLLRCGAPEGDIPALADALGDYIDADNLKRLNGAEAFDYRAGSEPLPAPRNQRLVSREELWRVKGWPALRPAWQAAGCDDRVTVNGDGLINRSTASREVLIALGMDETGALGEMENRRAGVPRGASPATAVTSTGTDPLSNLSAMAGGIAGKTLRVRLQSRSLEWALEYELELTPDRAGGPWRMREIRYPPHVAGRPVPPAAAQLPAVDHQPSAQDPSTDAQPRLPFGN